MKITFFQHLKLLYDKDLPYKKYCTFFIIVNFTWFLFTYFENILLEQLSLENNQYITRMKPNNINM